MIHSQDVEKIRSIYKKYNCPKNILERISVFAKSKRLAELVASLIYLGISVICFVWALTNNWVSDYNHPNVYFLSLLNLLASIAYFSIRFNNTKFIGLKFETNDTREKLTIDKILEENHFNEEEIISLANKLREESYAKENKINILVSVVSLSSSVVAYPLTFAFPEQMALIFLSVLLVIMLCSAMILSNSFSSSLNKRIAILLLKRMPIGE